MEAVVIVTIDKNPIFITIGILLLTEPSDPVGLTLNAYGDLAISLGTSDTVRD